MLGNSTTNIWNTNNCSLLVNIDPLGLTNSWSYKSDFLYVLNFTNAATHVAQYAYDSTGNLIRHGLARPGEALGRADEDPWSINDGALAVTIRANPATVEWIDRPASYHGLACGFTFADGHAEVHRWHDARTALQPGVAPRATQPNNPDIRWVMERTTAKR